MVQSKRKYKKKNRKTRKQRGGLDPPSNDKGIPLFNKISGQKVPTEEQKCVKSMKDGSKYNIDIPIWIDRLWDPPM